MLSMSADLAHYPKPAVIWIDSLSCFEKLRVLGLCFELRGQLKTRAVAEMESGSRWKPRDYSLLLLFFMLLFVFRPAGLSYTTVVMSAASAWGHKSRSFLVVSIFWQGAPLLPHVCHRHHRVGIDAGATQGHCLALIPEACTSRQDNLQSPKTLNQPEAHTS